jgi:protein-export membrane protein SecD
VIYFAPWKVWAIVLAVLLGLVFALPNFLPQVALDDLPGWWPKQRINLGLDLQGGSHLLLEVEVEAVVQERLEALVEDVRSALREARIGYTGLVIREGAVSLRVREPADVERAVEILRDLATPVSSGLLGGGARDLEVETAEGGRVVLRLTEAAREARQRAAVEQSLEIVRRRLDELGTRELSIQRQGEDRILVQLPGVDDPGRIKDLLGTTAKLTFQLVDLSLPPDQVLRGRVPPGTELLPSEEPGAPPMVVRKRVIVSGENLVDAEPGFDQRTGEAIVSFRFDSAGARRFAEVTRENVGKPFAIVLDEKVISAPVIREPILGGSGQISGNFTVESANDLAVLLRAGALPAPLSVLEERTVGPELGADSITAGQRASVISFVAVALYMVASYGLFGLFADIALVVNVVLILGVLSLLQATLTLPGIAGIVLTMGMAVDANVLIYERMREEIRNGRSPINAIEAGFQRAFATILDSNVTTLIPALILFQLGAGPVRGFAVALTIGLLTSVFTAFTVTRLMIATWLRRRRPRVLAL